MKKIPIPLTIKTDREYYSELKKTLNEFVVFVEHINIDYNFQKYAVHIKEKILKILRDYLKGDIADAQIQMNNWIKKICDEDIMATSEIEKCIALRENGRKRRDYKYGITPFFRARIDAPEDGFKVYDMMSVPFSVRSKISTERFSLPGFPCFYAGNTSYVCWLEMGKPADHRFNVSPVFLDNKLKVFDLTLCIGDFKDIFSEYRRSMESGVSPDVVLSRMMLMISSSFRIEESGRKFKSEYIIPQLIMLACQKNKLNGVAYISSKISDASKYGNCAVDVALFAGYPKNRFVDGCDDTALKDYITVGDAFNYAMFKQILESPPDIDWRDFNQTESLGIKQKIESGGTEFYYSDTLFDNFDEFLVTNYIRKNGDDFFWRN